MKWNKYRLATTTEAVDLISYTLAEMGIEGIEIEDKVPLSEEDKKRMFIDLLPDLEEDDGKAYVSFYIEPEKDHDSTLEEVLAAVRELADFVDIGEATIEKSQTEDIDWIDVYKRQVYSTGSIRPIRDEIMLSPSARLLMVEIAAKTIRIIPNILQSPRFSAFSPANPATSPRMTLIRLKIIKKEARATPAPTLPAAPPIRAPSPREPAMTKIPPMMLKTM